MFVWFQTCFDAELFFIEILFCSALMLIHGSLTFTT